MGVLDRLFRRRSIPHDPQRMPVALQAVEQAPPGSPDLADHLKELGNRLSQHYALTGELASLERAIQAYEQAVEQTPPGSPELPRHLTNLSAGLRDRYVRKGELADLERAIDASQQAIEQTSPGSPDLPTHLTNLGVGLRNRYWRTGNPVDLERAIDAFQQAIEQTPPGFPDLPGHLSNLGLGLRNRYGQTGELADLQRAVEVLRQAVKQAPRGWPYLYGILHNLGGALRDLYTRTGELADLERAIKAHEQATAQTPASSPDLPMFLNSLGLALMRRYEQTVRLADLERTIEVYEQALEQTQPDSLELAKISTNLGTAVRERYARTRQLADLRRAIAAQEQAVEQTPPGSPGLIVMLSNLGLVLEDQYKATEAPTDLDVAIGAWERAWSLLQTTFVAAPVAYKLGQQRHWAGLYDSLVSAHLHRAESGLAEAVAARRRAMEVVEGSKSRLLTELLSRGDLPAPSAIPQEQAARERELLEALTILDTAELEMHGQPVMPQEEAGSLERFDRREQHTQELGDLWKEMAQSGPEAADYVALRRGEPLDWDDLVSLAADLGPETALLSLFTTSNRCLLFVMRQGWEEPTVVEADLDRDAQANISRRFLREVQFYDGTSRRVETWDRPLRLLLEKAAVHLSGVERIIFAPHALGHLLPWSVVAWRAELGGPDGRSPSLVTLPALGMLPRLRRRPAGGGSGALVAGNPRGDLEHAGREAQKVAKKLGTEPLIESQATKKAVLERLSDASIVHLATHAYFAPGSPLDSGIVLADGVLTAREVMSHRLQADLLVLSACQTGMAEALGGDELAGLAQAFLQAGARSLVVSLWSVNDPATAALMTAFYAARHAGGDKATALSQAMADVRKEWPHPYYWGGFVLMGDWA